MLQKLISVLGSQPNQWQPMPKNPYELTLKNTLTEQQYTVYKFQNTDSEYQQLYRRQFQHLPNTPKIRLIKILENRKQEIYVLVQFGQFMLDKLAEEYEKEYVSLIRLALNIVIVGEMLYKKYGYFRFNAHMVRVTCNSNFVLWIHQSFVANSPQFCLFGKSGQDRFLMKIMVLSLLQTIIEKIPKLRKLLEALQRNQNNQLNFQNTKKFIVNQIKRINSQKNLELQRNYKSKSKVPHFILARSSNSPKQPRYKAANSQRIYVNSRVYLGQEKSQKIFSPRNTQNTQCSSSISQINIKSPRKTTSPSYFLSPPKSSYNKQSQKLLQFVTPKFATKNSQTQSNPQDSPIKLARSRIQERKINSRIQISNLDQMWNSGLQKELQNLLFN